MSLYKNILLRVTNPVLFIYTFFTMNLSERYRLDKELFSGERLSHENTLRSNFYKNI
jgi:hypothetical protein